MEVAMQNWRYKKGRIFLLRISSGADLLQELQDFITEKDIQCGEIYGIGALDVAHVGYYDHGSRTYKENVINESVEIASLVGNISQRDQKNFVHAHIVIADKTGAAYGGHLMPGCKVFACEVSLKEFDGDTPQRMLDSETGLFLWQEDGKR
jgi:predicted DNA-binding protein with PD1-like motif